MEVEEKEFFHKQALDAKRKNKLLKLAVTRMQTDAVPDNQEPMMIASSQEEEAPPKDQENLKDNTFLTGANIEERLDDEAIDNMENS